MVEFDVRRCRDALVLVHDEHLSVRGGLRRRVRDCTLAELRQLDLGDGERFPTLREAVAVIKGRAEMNLDLKEAGYEVEVLDVLAQHDVLGDVLVSSLMPASLRAVKALVPAVPVALSYPEDKGGVSAKPRMAPVVRLILWLLRLTVPWRIPGMIARAHANAAMLHQQLVSPRLIAVVHRAGYRVFAWTVDDIVLMRRLRAMGMDGIASNRPDLFAQL